MFAKGEQTPSYEKISAMARFFHVHPDILMGVRRLEDMEFNEHGEPIIDLHQGEVVRRQYLSCANDTAMVIRPDSVTFSSSCVRKWEDVNYVHLIVIRSKRLVILKKSKEEDMDAQRWNNRN